MEFLKRNIEYIMIVLVLVALVLKYQQVSAADGMLLMMAASLSFFYLLSGLLVLLDRARIERVMRILYFVGMWSIAICVIGIVFRILNWQVNRELLIVGMSSGLAILLFALLNRRGQEGEVLKAFDREISPLVKRVLPFALFAAGIFLTSEINLYRNFGQFRDDTKYVQLLDAHLSDRSDDTARTEWETYHQAKLAEAAEARRNKRKPEAEENEEQ